MTPPGERRRLPDGTFTTSTKAYTHAWRELARPIMEAMNVELVGYDPGLMFRRESGSSFDVPIDLAMAFAAIANENDKE